MLLFSAMLTVVVFAGSTNSVFAVEQSNTTIAYPKITTNGDLYVDSDIPIQIPFSVTAVDGFNNTIPVGCDKTPNNVFKTGKTTVRCIAFDSFGRETRESFVVTVGYEIVQIPDWFKHTANFWASQVMSDDEYIQTLNFLMDENIIHVPHTKMPKDNTDSDIPVWLKTNAEKWSEGEISNDEFSIGIQWMLNHGLIQN